MRWGNFGLCFGVFVDVGVLFEIIDLLNEKNQILNKENWMPNEENKILKVILDW